MARHIKIQFRGLAHDYDSGFVLMFDVEAAESPDDESCSWVPVLLWSGAGTPGGDYWCLQFGCGPNSFVSLQGSPVYNHFDRLYGENDKFFVDGFDLTHAGEVHACEGVHMLFDVGYLQVDERLNIIEFYPEPK